MNPEVLTYADLQREVLQALRLQHPEWVQSDGASPIYDRYEARLAELLRVAAVRRRKILILAKVPVQMTATLRPPPPPPPLAVSAVAVAGPRRRFEAAVSPPVASQE